MAVHGDHVSKWKRGAQTETGRRDATDERLSNALRVIFFQATLKDRMTSSTAAICSMMDGGVIWSCALFLNARMGSVSFWEV